MNKRIENVNFKKVFIIYIAFLILALVGIGAFWGIKYKDKLSFIYYYHLIGKQFETGGYDEHLSENLNHISKGSQDIADILVLDKSNKVLYSGKSSEFAAFDVFTLERIDTNEKSYFVNSNSQKAVFKLIKGKELILSSIFSDLDSKIKNDYTDDIFFEPEFNQKDIYFLSYIANKATGEKIYFINKVHPIVGSDMYLKAAAAALVFLFMVYWVLSALVIYQNALRSKLNPYLWGGIALVTNLAGIILYIIYKQSGTTCKKCNAFQHRNNIYCTVCGAKINEVCEKCSHVVRKEDKHCANCGNKL